MEFRRPYDERPGYPATCHGTKFEPEYTERIDDNGVRYIVKTGEKNVYDIIQSHKDECDINRIIQQYSEAGMMAELQSDAQIDLTSMPQTYAEYLNQMIRLENQFKALPAAVKERFNNNFEIYAATAGTEEWASKLGYKKEMKANEPEQREPLQPDSAGKAPASEV